MPPTLVPELTVADYGSALRFYCEVLGWQIVYDRPDEEFAYLRCDGAELMIDGLRIGRNFNVALIPDHRPFGRGVNLEITVPAVQPLLDALEAAGHALHLPPEEKWYSVGTYEVGQGQFIVADPDGYLLRFAESLGTRPLQAGDAI